MTGLTPMMRQYRAVKAQHPDTLLFFRLGDFYEMFFEDATLAARELEIALTGRDGGGERVPMCGVPYHSAENYIARLVDKGYKIAICEQVEDPRQAKGLVRREVVRVITPGTQMDSRLLGQKRNNYLAALAPGSGAGAVADDAWGLAVADVSTGEFLCAQFAGEGARRQAWEELARFGPAEVLLPPALAGAGGGNGGSGTNVVGGGDGANGVSGVADALRGSFNAAVTVRPDATFDGEGGRQRLCAHFGTASLAGFGCEDKPLAVAAAGALLEYLGETQKGAAGQITGLRLFEVGNHMALDGATRRNLELTARLGGEREGSLLSVLDRTVTAMGGRLLRQWVERPLVDLAAIGERLDAVEELVNDAFLRADLREALKGIYDLERLAGRVAGGTANARDLAALGASLERLPRLAALIQGRGAALLQAMAAQLDTLEGVANLLRRAIADEPPLALTEGGLIRPGFNAQVDDLRRANSEGKDWIAALEARERERTGIKSLKVGFNKVFGYYIEVSHANRHLVPADFVRKQTLANAERYITPELKEQEDRVLGAAERLVALEYQLFQQVREEVARHTAAIQATARAVAGLDALANLAEVAVRRGYCKPVVDESDVIAIRGGRHPVLEEVLAPGEFVPNDADLDGGEQRLLLVTGPNMAGKSTFARQVALAVILAQMGSFVPAASCRVGLVDRVFTRIGAADDLFSGQSTFMVEMNEVANILHNATARSLVVLDEVGRGTSTFDGISIAWAVSEHLHDHTGARTLFTTHYHELTALEERLPGVRNYTVAVKEQGEEVVFLRRVVPGAADRSYGIQVARLAGLPREVLRRAMEILRELERSEAAREARRQVVVGMAAPGTGVAVGGTVTATGMANGPGNSHSHGHAAGQISFLPPPEHLEALRELLRLDPLTLTPLQAMNKLFKLQALANGSKEDRP